MAQIAKVRKPKAERIVQQIGTLVGLGKSADEIAAFLDVTVDSLQVACSRLRLNLQKTAEKGAASGNANLLLAMQRNGFEQATSLRLSSQTIANLILEAEVRGTDLGQLLAMIVTTATANGLSKVLDGVESKKKAYAVTGR